MSAGEKTRWEQSLIAAREAGSVLLQRVPSTDVPGRVMLFRDPVAILQARQPADVAPALARIEEMLAQGLYLAGYIAYEAGFALESSLADLTAPLPGSEPLLWLGCYRPPHVVEDASMVEVAANVPAAPAALEFSLGRMDFERKVAHVRSLIAAGDTYQANLTMDLLWRTDEAPAALYRRLLLAQPVPYAALLHPVPEQHILSFSPELFFLREGDRIVTRPMKGTAAPGLDLAEIRAQTAWLHADSKNRAENVMIVDLLRSDLGRICQMGSVQATRLFEVERYPAVLQMTSTVEGRLRSGITYLELLRALFPSGSIVGAPKIHTMRLLHQLEGRPRGVYTGAIGYLAPDGRAEFNVAIRTVSLRSREARFGVGAGITFDSDSALEYEECRTKTRFLHRVPGEAFQLVETLLLQDGRYTFEEEHLKRMGDSAVYFNMSFDPARAQHALETAAQRWQGTPRVRVRLLLHGDGSLRWTAAALDAPDYSRPLRLLLAPERTDPSDHFFRHKTTRRALYDEAHKRAQDLDCADALFRNARGEITEGAVHNVIACLRGEWVTPPLSSGVLPGIYRGHLLASGRISERVLTLADLVAAEHIVLCNSVRGVRRIERIVEVCSDATLRMLSCTPTSGDLEEAWIHSLAKPEVRAATIAAVKQVIEQTQARK